jgi:hypothetical protein
MQRVNGVLERKKVKAKKSDRIVTLFDNTVKFLKEMKTRDKSLKLEKGIELEYVFHWEDGRPMDPHYIAQHFPKIFEDHKNIPKIRFHDLRHTYATRLFEVDYNTINFTNIFKPYIISYEYFCTLFNCCSYKDSIRCFKSILSSKLSRNYTYAAINVFYR